MNDQLDLFSSTPASNQVARQLATKELERNPRDYQKHGFDQWIQANWSIWERFCALANRTRELGFSNYSARAVLHILRWHVRAQEVKAKGSDKAPAFAISNTWSPMLARLFNAMDPNNAGFFRTASSGGV